MMNNNGERVKRITLSILKGHPEGLTIRSLSDITGMHRQTITKYILELKGSGIVYRRRVGSATLHYLKEQYNGNIERSDAE
jgi:DNA-binding transcriptional ArsR family regulator